MTKILGISAFYHDSSAALIVNGVVTCAVQEERFSRIKHDSSFPNKSIIFILKNHNLTLNDIDHIVFYEKPFVKFERLIETYLAFVPRGFSSFKKAMPIWCKEKLFQKKIIKEELFKIDNKLDKKTEVFFSDHHLSHAASAFFPSPFHRATIVTLDGVGEWSTTVISKGEGNKIENLKKIDFPHSVGLLYSAFTYYLGFKVNSGEYKLMGLAPYGKPRYKKLILDELIDLKEDGSFRLNMKYFDYAAGLKMTNNKFNNLFNNIFRKNELDDFNENHMDLAASIQEITEEIIVRICRHAIKLTNINNLCLAGGVALNCVANGKLLERLKINKLWIQPASGDSGCSLGASLAYWYIGLKQDRKIKEIEIKDKMNGSLLGPSFSNDDVLDVIKNNYQGQIKYTKLNDIELINKVCRHIVEGRSIGWFQGKMEFGPRALGSRSILADPRNIQMQKNLNLKIKFRESFRPFAPIVMEDKVNDWFELNDQSPYMLLVSKVKKEKLKENNTNSKSGFNKLMEVRSEVPAVTHVDNSARIQTVNKENNLKLYLLLEKFFETTGCPVLINTSFNIRGEPIVCTVKDALKCFMSNNLDILVCENYMIEKKNLNFVDPNLMNRLGTD